MKIFLSAILALTFIQISYCQTETEYYSKLTDKYKFEEFPIEKVCNIGPTLDSLSWCELRDLPEEIKSNIVEQFTSNTNFIGSCYKYASWGCGSPCQMIAIFNINNGKLVGTLNSSLSFLIKSDSRLIFLNPPSEEKIDIEYRQTVGEPKFFELLNGQIRKLEK